MLVHPVWQTASAYFTELTLTQEPRDDYVAYRFTFCEAPGVRRVPGAADDSLSQAIGKRFCEVGAGQTLWEICTAYRLSMQALLRLNPQIAKPNSVAAGTRVRVQ